MTRWLALLLLLAAPLVPWSQARIDGELGQFRAQEEVLYLWTGDQVGNVLPGFEGLAADVYWLRTVQYYGGKKAYSVERRFELLGPLIDITTTLDPRLEIAYRYGAAFLCEYPPSGAGRPKEGIAVLEKGVRNLPDSWRLRQDLGFFHFLYLRDAQTAARVLLEAAEIPGAAFWLRMLAADLLRRGGDRESSRRMWRQMYDQAEEGILKRNAELQLQILDALDQADALTDAVGEFEARHRRRPDDLRELRASGAWTGSLVDPNGTPFRYDVSEGRVSIHRASLLWRPH